MESRQVTQLMNAVSSPKHQAMNLEKNWGKLKKKWIEENEKAWWRDRMLLVFNKETLLHFNYVLVRNQQLIFAFTIGLLPRVTKLSC